MRSDSHAHSRPCSYNPHLYRNSDPVVPDPESQPCSDA